MCLKRYLLLLLFSLLFLSFSFFNLARINHPATEFDEGVYITTFQLANAGYPLYRDTFFSQFPGFFVAVNPIFIQFGQTLQAGRMGMLFWSLVGILAIIWIGYELESVFFALLAIAWLSLMPLYMTEIVTFHADALSSVFSLLALAALLRFGKGTRIVWLVLAASAFAAAVVIKLDVTLLPSLTLLLFAARRTTGKIMLRNMFIGLVSWGVMFAIVILPFDRTAIWTTVIPFRTLVTLHSVFFPQIFLQLLGSQPQLLCFLTLGMLLTIISLSRNYGKRVVHGALLFWVITTCAVLFFYHPLFLHHLFLLTIPVALLFSYSTSLLLSNLSDTRKRTAFMLLSCSIILFFGIGTMRTLALHQTILTNNELVAINYVQRYTQPSDFIISDDGIINGVTRRLAPPNLSDLSFVRLQSGDITPQRFAQSLTRYKPRMIIAWTYRINTLPSFNQLLEDNNYTLIYQNGAQQKIYMK